MSSENIKYLEWEVMVRCNSRTSSYSTKGLKECLERVNAYLSPSNYGKLINKVIRPLSDHDDPKKVRNDVESALRIKMGRSALRPFKGLKVGPEPERL